MTSDKELVRQYKNGNDEAFRDLVTKYQRDLVSIANYLVGDREIAEDISQESFLKSARRISNCKSSFRNLLYKIHIKSCMNYTHLNNNELIQQATRVKDKYKIVLIKGRESPSQLTERLVDAVRSSPIVVSLGESCCYLFDQKRVIKKAKENSVELLYLHTCDSQYDQDKEQSDVHFLSFPVYRLVDGKSMKTLAQCNSFDKLATWLLGTVKRFAESKDYASVNDDFEVLETVLAKHRFEVDKNLL